MTEHELAIVRRCYALQMTRGEAGPVQEAFASVRREDFLGVDPWTLIWPGLGLFKLPENDPVHAYQDVLVALDPARHVNNGSPSLHALMLGRLGVAPGDRVAHVGAGTGYYSAILAELAGTTGHVSAIEYDEALAETARRNLAGRANVTVVNGDGAVLPESEVDRIYVNFAATRPAAAWLDRLSIGGSLVFPLATPDPDRPNGRLASDRGAVLQITRTAGGFAAAHVSRCGFVMARGALAGDERRQRALVDAFNRGGVEFVASLRWGRSPPERCWFWSPEWSLSYDPPPVA